jgi:hypothetical protein
VNPRAGAVVPAGWGVYNGLWLVVMAGMGGTAVNLWLYAGAVTITMLFACCLVLSRWRHQLEASRFPVGLRGEASGIAAGGIAIVGLGFVFGAWFFPLGGAFVLWGAALVLMDSKSRHPRPS